MKLLHLVIMLFITHSMSAFCDELDFDLLGNLLQGKASSSKNYAAYKLLAGIYREIDNKEFGKATIGDFGRVTTGFRKKSYSWGEDYFPWPECSIDFEAGQMILRASFEQRRFRVLSIEKGVVELEEPEYENSHRTLRYEAGSVSLDGQSFFRISGPNIHYMESLSDSFNKRQTTLQNYAGRLTISETLEVQLRNEYRNLIRMLLRGENSKLVNKMGSDKTVTFVGWGSKNVRLNSRLSFPMFARERELLEQIDLAAMEKAPLVMNRYKYLSPELVPFPLDKVFVVECHFANDQLYCLAFSKESTEIKLVGIFDFLLIE